MLHLFTSSGPLMVSTLTDESGSQYAGCTNAGLGGGISIQLHSATDRVLSSAPGMVAVPHFRALPSAAASIDVTQSAAGAALPAGNAQAIL